MIKTLIATLLSTCIMTGFVAAQEKKPLDNQGLLQISKEWGAKADDITGIKGKKVNLKVVIRIRQDNTIYCSLIDSNGGDKRGKEGTLPCHAHLDNIKPDAAKNLEDGGKYLLEGVIVADAMCYSAFWIDANKLTKIE